MEASNIEWVITILVSGLVGLLVGVLGYHLFNRSSAGNQKKRQRMAEIELELNQTKEAIDVHFLRTRELVDSIKSQSEMLEQQLAQDSQRLSATPKLKNESSITPPLEMDASTPAMPRDYADGNHGTLSEDFGLEREEKEKNQPPLQVPRY